MAKMCSGVGPKNVILAFIIVNNQAKVFKRLQYMKLTRYIANSKDIFTTKTASDHEECRGHGPETHTLSGAHPFPNHSCSDTLP